VVKLEQWSNRFDVPLLSSFIDAVQTDNPAAAVAAGLNQARAMRADSSAVLLSEANPRGSFSRSNGN